MKKKLAVILAASTMAASLAACGGSGSSGGTEAAGTAGNKETTAQTGGGAPAQEAGGEGLLTVAWWGNQTRNERTQAALDKYSELNPGVSFDGQFSEWSDYWNKLATAAAGHSLPDVLQMDYAYLDQYVTNNLLVDLTPYIEDGTLNVDDCSQDIIGSGSVAGALIPMGMEYSFPPT